MRSRVKRPWKAAGTAVAVALACTAGLAAAGPGAQRSASAAPVRATAAITSCKGERLVLAFSLRASGKGSRAAKRAVRRLRGARLEVRLEAVALFGGSPATPWINLGKRLKASRGQAFQRLPAGVWTGVVDYRWLKGKKVVRSGSMRTERGRVRGKRGRELCTLAVGRPPRDTTPPKVSLSPDDAAWRRAPVRAGIFAGDELSGVARVFHRLDDGPIRFGRSLTIAAEGAHQVSYGAHDVAGNRSATRRGTVRVDAGAPTKPVLDRPAATGPALPEIRWSRASDSGSGVRRYVVLVRNSSDFLVASRTVAATGAAKQSVTLSDPLPLGSYTAQVLAVDGVEPEPFASSSDRRAFAVTAPRVTASDPANDALRSYAERTDTLTVDFDRSMANVNAGSVKLTALATGGLVTANVTCNASCTRASLTPTSPLSGGKYQLRVQGVSSTGGDALPTYTATFRQVIYEDAFEGSCPTDLGGDLGNPWLCFDSRGDMTGKELQTKDPKRCGPVDGDRDWTVTTESVPYVAAANEQVEVRVRRFFEASSEAGDAGTVDVLVDGNPTPVASSTYSPGTATGDETITFSNASAGTHQLKVRFQLHLELAPLAIDCSSEPGPGFFVDDLQIVTAP